MRKSVIAVILSIIMTAGSIGNAPVFAAEATTTQETIEVDAAFENSLPAEDTVDKDTEQEIPEEGNGEIITEAGFGQGSIDVEAEESDEQTIEDEDSENEDPAIDFEDNAEEISSTGNTEETTTEISSEEEPANGVEESIEDEVEQKDSKDAASVFAGGSGTQQDPYQVKTAAQLDAVRNYEGKYFIQTSNIDLNGSEWKPISGENKYSSFNYDGNGYEISNLTIKNYVGDSNQYSNGIIGLFASVSGLENIKVKNAEINLSFNNGASLRYVGIIAGRGGVKNCSAEGSITIVCGGNTSCFIGGVVGGCFNDIQNCHSNVDIVCTSNGDYCYVGGICGYSAFGDFTRLYSEGSIKVYGGSKACIGGIVGLAESGDCSVSMCVNLGEISSSNTSNESYISGIIGHAEYNGLIESCVNFGDIEGNNNNVVSGIALLNTDTDYESVIRNCYNIGNIKGSTVSGRITGLPNSTYNQMLIRNFAYENSTVNGTVPSDRVGTASPNGGNISAPGIRVAVSDILSDCGCEWPDIDLDDNYFVIGRDSNSFSHDDSSFGTSIIGQGRIGAAYPTSLYYYSKLLDGLKYTEQIELLDTMNDGSWGGSCEGLSISLGMAYLGKIDVSKFDGLFGSAPTCYYDLMPPCANLSLRDLINYYQLLQSAKKHNNSKDRMHNLGPLNCIIDGFWTLYPNRNKFWKDFVKEVKDANSKRTPLLFSMGYYSSSSNKDVGHTILTCGYNETNQYYIIQFFDCNCTSYGQKYLYLFIDKSTYDFWFSLSGDSIVSFNHYASNNNWRYFEYFGTDDWNTIDSDLKLSGNKTSISNSPSKMKSGNQYMYFTVSAGEAFRLENNTGQYLEYNNNELNSTLEIYDFDIIGDSSKY